MDEVAGLHPVDAVPFALDVRPQMHDPHVVIADLPLDARPLFRRPGSIVPAHRLRAVLFLPPQVVLDALDDLLPTLDGLLAGLLLEREGILDLLLAGGIRVRGRLGHFRIGGLGLRILPLVLVLLPAEQRTLLRGGHFDYGLFPDSLLEVPQGLFGEDAVILEFVLVPLVRHRPEHRGLEEDARPEDPVAVMAGHLVILPLDFGHPVLFVLIGRIGGLELPHQVHREHRDGHHGRLGIVGLEYAVGLEIGH